MNYFYPLLEQTYRGDYYKNLEYNGIHLMLQNSLTFRSKFLAVLAWFLGAVLMVFAASFALDFLVGMCWWRNGFMKTKVVANEVDFCAFTPCDIHAYAWRGEVCLHVPWLNLLNSFGFLAGQRVKLMGLQLMKCLPHLFYIFNNLRSIIRCVWNEIGGQLWQLL